MGLSPKGLRKLPYFKTYVKLELFLDLKCGTILNLDCGILLNLDCGTNLNLYFRILSNISFRTFLNYNVTFLTLTIHAPEIVPAQKSASSHSMTLVFFIPPEIIRNQSFQRVFDQPENMLEQFY